MITVGSSTHTLRGVSAMAVLGAVLALTGCGSAAAPRPAGPPVPTASFPATIGSVTLAQAPTRIVSLSPTATEILFSINAGNAVVAVDERSNFPASAPKSELSAVTPDAAAIATYQPDLVVLAADVGQISDQLAAMKIPTLVAPEASTVDDTYAQIADLGTLSGHPAEAAAEIGRMRAAIGAEVRDLPPRVKPLTYYYEQDDSYHTVTSKSFLGSLFASAGLVNIADAAGTGDNADPRLSAAAVISANPDLIFLADTTCCAQSASTVTARPGWSDLTAVRANGIVTLDPDLAATWGPRVVDLLRAITDGAARAPVG